MAKEILTSSEWPVVSWKPEDADKIFKELEKPNWAPWLAASLEAIKARAEVFPAGQLCMWLPGKDIMVATLSTNQINWDGNPSNLPCWDEVAGEPTTYENTYIPTANTLVLMSMNVRPGFYGQGLAGKMINQIQQTAKVLGIEYLIGSFRPNQLGQYKAETGNWQIDFGEYCLLTREDGLPVDGWLRSLTRKGMVPLAVDNQAMTVKVSLKEFYQYQDEYKPDFWQEVAPEIWECGEVGQWQVNKESGLAVYQESNLWGKLPF